MARFVRHSRREERGSYSRFRQDIKRQLLFFVNITHNFISCVLKVADDSENRGISYAFDRMTGPGLFFKDAIACTSLDGSTSTRWKRPLRDSRACFIICNAALALIRRIHTMKNIFMNSITRNYILYYL